MLVSNKLDGKLTVQVINLLVEGEKKKHVLGKLEGSLPFSKENINIHIM